MMEVLDATSLAERLKWEAKEYWLHLEAETPLEKYPAKQHARRVQEKLGVETGLIYLPGQQAKNNEDSDMPAPFRQHRYFYYLSGCNESDCHLTYDIQHDTLSLFIPRIDERRVIWYGRGPTLAEALVKYDVDEVYYSDEISDYLMDWFQHSRNKGNLYFLHATKSAKHPLENSCGRIDTTLLRPAMNLARMVKDDHEIKLIQKANDISSKAHREVLANILKFNNEAQVEGLFLDMCVSQQAKQQAYDPIAASGPNAGTLHYDANNEKFEDRQLMCLDAGCEYELYASDITRTFPLSSTWPSKEAKNIYKLVEHMQESCIKRLAPGVRYLDLHILAHQIAIDGLLALGILHNGTKEEIYKAGTSKAFFPHGLGHHIGLEVHDVGQAELMSIRQGKTVPEQAPSLYPKDFHLSVYDRETCYAPADPQSSHLEEGMVVTVEPGIYFSVYALQHFYLPSPIHSRYINLEVVRRYLPIGGVRIEDDILITSKGYNNLTTAPKGDEMLEIIRGGKSNNTAMTVPKKSPRTRTIEKTSPLLRAPGISTEKMGSILKPIARAATMPAEFKQQNSTDFEPFVGPSLFTNFKRSMTTDEMIQHWQRDRDSALALQDQSMTTMQSTSVCGTNNKGVRHTYMTSGSHRVPPPGSSFSEHFLPVCKNCIILCETLDRLRKNLTLSEQSSPKSEEAKPNCVVATKNEDLIDVRNNDLAAIQQPRQWPREKAYDVQKGRNGNDWPTRGIHRSSDQAHIRGQPAIDRRQEAAQKRTLIPSHRSQPPLAFATQSVHDSNLSPKVSGKEQSVHCGKSLMNEPHPKYESQYHTSEQLGKTGNPLHNDVQRALVLLQHNNRELEEQAQAQQTLVDLKTQRRKYPIPENMRCRVGTQGDSPPSLWEKSKVQANAPKMSTEDKLDQMIRQIRDLEAQIRAYTPLA